MKLRSMLLVLIAFYAAGCAKTPEPTPPATEAAPPTKVETAPATPAATPAPDSSATDPGAPDPAAEVNKSIDTLLSDHAAYRQVFDQLQTAVSTGDKQGVASLVSFPLDATIDGRKQQIKDAVAFLADYDKIVTPAIAQVVTQQKFQDVFVNYKGVMLGQGEVWINGLCKDDQCSKVDVRVITIQPTSDASP